MSNLKKPTHEIIERVADDLKGTSDSVEQSLIRLDLEEYDQEEIESELDMHIEKCKECEWWCEVGELADEEGETVPCESCRS